MTLKTFTMDSNENKCPLMETPAQEVADSIVATNISAAPLQSKEEVIARLEEINQQETTGDKSELDLIKQTFYRLRNAEVELARKEGTHKRTKRNKKDKIILQRNWPSLTA